MEPLLIPVDTPEMPELQDLALQLATSSAGFRRSLPSGIVSALADLVRSMNCYYSNLIEGHHTHPIDIERALGGDYSHEPEKRDLQLEAKAHIEVQRWIDAGGIGGSAVSVTSLREIHRRFSENLPIALRRVTNPETQEIASVVPGETRRRDVRVGRHLAVSAGAVPRFLDRFETAFGSLSRSEQILSVAAAHHRLLWIHPFLDGNGRVARLMSHAMLLDLVETGGIWSIARGLARRESEYKTHLSNCDQPRESAVDGRGALSLRALIQFTRFFLQTSLDQVRFMEELVQPDRLRVRIMQWANEEIQLGKLPDRSASVLEAILYRGELPRADVAATLGIGDRQARRVVASLVERRIVQSASSRAPLKLAFPAELASRWMPGLFPER
ncbi:MAG: Fic family protein [Deltaproteobacteria bacterium]|nr:Fic family protein [Deltaproteobacteria bacterium]